MSETMNGGTMKIPGITEGNPIVQQLEQVLAAAKAGQISSLAVIAIGPNGIFPPVVMGPQRGDLYLALDYAKAALMASVFAPQQQKPNIVRAPDMPGLKV